MAHKFLEKDFLVEKAFPVVVAGGAGVGCAIAGRNSVLKAKTVREQRAATVQDDYRNNKVSRPIAMDEIRKVSKIEPCLSETDEQANETSKMVQKAENLEAKRRLKTEESLASKQKKNNSSDTSLRGGGGRGWRRRTEGPDQALQTISVDPLPSKADSSGRPFIFDPNPNFVFWVVFFISGTFFYFFNNTMKNIKNKREEEKFNRIYH